MKVLDTKCPKCGAIMRIDVKHGKAVCDICEKANNIGKKTISQEETVHHEKKVKKNEQTQYLKFVAIFVAILGGIMAFTFILKNFTKTEVDPFEQIEVGFFGYNGSGKVTIEVTENEEDAIDMDKIEFDISKKENLSQGETIVITARSEEYRLSTKEQEFQVDGLDVFIQNFNNLKAEAEELVHLKSETTLELNLKEAKEQGKFVSMKGVKMYIVTDNQYYNYLYDVYETVFNTTGGEKTIYLVVSYRNLSARDTASVSIEDTGCTYVGELQILEGTAENGAEAQLSIMGYENLEELKNELASAGSHMDIHELDVD